jgi:cytochrome c
VSMRRTSVGLGALTLALLAGCNRGAEERAAQLTGGDPARGKVALQHYGCGGCHVIPGVPNAQGQVGPSLEAIGMRTYLAGRLTNSPENLMQWVRHPQQVEPGNAMPDVGVTEEDSRHIAAYLYTLR